MLPVFQSNKAIEKQPLAVAPSGTTAVGLSPPTVSPEEFAQIGRVAAELDSKLTRTFGSRLRKAREAQRRSQQEIASQLNLKRQAVQNWEAGRTTPEDMRPETWRPIADMLHVTVEWLLFDMGPETDKEETILKAALREILRDIRPIIRRIEDLTDT